MGFYLEPDDASTIERSIAYIVQRPCRTEIMVAGNPNGDLAVPEISKKDEDIVVVLVATGLEDTLTHFLPYKWYWE